jgi:RimJ/RimL family protein N-acetyltransferase
MTRWAETRVQKRGFAERDRLTPRGAFNPLDQQPGSVPQRQAPFGTVAHAEPVPQQAGGEAPATTELTVRPTREPHERRGTPLDVRTPLQRPRVARRDPGEDAPGDGTKFTVENEITTRVGAFQHRCHKGGVAHVDRGPVERLVGEAQAVEAPEGLRVADQLDQVGEEVSLTAGQVVDPACGGVTRSMHGGRVARACDINDRVVTPELRTERLVLRAWRTEDRESFAALNADPVVMEYYPSTLTRAESDAFVERIEAGFARRGWGLWAVEVAGGAAFIGYVGFAYADFPAAFTPAVEIGWRLAAGYWGRGHATEAARAAVTFGFDQLGFADIVSFTSQLNLRSQRVMQKLGMTRDPRDDFDHPGVPEGHHLRRHVLYRLAAPAAEDVSGSRGTSTGRRG